MIEIDFEVVFDSGLSVSPGKRNEKMALSIKSVLIDLSGTLHIGNTLIPGSIEALDKLRNLNVNIQFVTNTTKESRKSLYNRLTNLGFNIKIDDIWTSLTATYEYLRSQKVKNPYLLVDDCALEDFADLAPNSTNSNYDCVVVGLAPDKFNYESLTKAFRILQNDKPLIAIHQARYYKREEDGGLALGPGPFIKALEFASTCQSHIVGKPSADFFKTALKNVNPQEAVMIGDDVRDDIAGAQDLGLKGILVKTGKYRPGDENTINPLPWKVVNSFPDAVNEILKNISK